jgi:UDP-GlcNAc:undecaprenyl-phosphate GlcNAc-1-phosphate transferase
MGILVDGAGNPRRIDAVPIDYRAFGLLMPLAVLVPVGFALGALGTWAARACAYRIGFFNHPNPIVEQHSRPVAYMGGAGLAVGASLTMVLHLSKNSHGALDASLRSTSTDVAIAVGAVSFLAFGLIDDARSFSPARKAAVQFALATVSALLGLVPHVTGLHLVDVAIGVGYVMVFLNAFNFTDVCDGLLGGLSVVLFSYVAWEYCEVRSVAAVVAASSAGFLVFNHPPASIFLGDAGSHALGFMAAALMISASRSECSALPLVVGAICAGVPLFELVFITLMRIRKGIPWWRGSPDHFALRLQKTGLSALQTDLVGCVCAIAVAGAAHTFHVVALVGRVIEIGVLLLVAATLGVGLVRLEGRPLPNLSE